MKGLLLPFNLEGKGVLDLELFLENGGFSGYSGGVSSCFLEKNCFWDSDFAEPTSVLDSASFFCRFSSSSTVSSSYGGGGAAGSTDTAGVAAVSDTNPSPKWQIDSATATSSNVEGIDSHLLPTPPALEIGGGGEGMSEKCAVDDWESVLTESVAASPSQEQSIFRWIMGDVEDPVAGSLNKALQTGYGRTGGSTAMELEFCGGFGSVDQCFGEEDDQFGANFISPIQNSTLISSSCLPSNFNFVFPATNPNIHGDISSAAMKPTIFNTHLMINQNQKPPFLFPSTNPKHQEQNLFAGDVQLSGDQILGRQKSSHQLQLLPLNLQQRSLVTEKLGNFHQQQQIIVDQLYKSAELVQTGNPLLAQGILARLNHQLSSIDNPFNRSAFYFKEAIQLLIHGDNLPSHSLSSSSPFTLLFKIGAYKAFSEISPISQFAIFTCNQALLEAFDGCNRIHIVDFDIDYGCQWASLIQELALRNDNLLSFKITAFTSSSSTSDQIDISLTRENLIQFAMEVNIELEFEVMNSDSLNSIHWLHVEDEVVAVRLPVSSLPNHQLSLPLALHFIKQLSPRIVVSVDRVFDRTDLSFANHVIHALQSCSNLLESLESVSINPDTLRKIERFFIFPAIEKIILWRFRSPEKTPHWKTQFLSSGFTPLMFSNFTEAQAECIVKKTPVRGFSVEKRHSSLVLTWHCKELISASAWRC